MKVVTIFLYKANNSARQTTDIITATTGAVRFTSSFPFVTNFSVERKEAERKKEKKEKRRMEIEIEKK